MRYAISGECTDAIAVDVTKAKNLLGENITTGRVLWLRHAHFYDASTAKTVLLYDVTQDSAKTAGKRKFAIPCASGRTTVVDFPAPGLKFSTGCCAIMDATATSGVTGSFEVEYIGGAGYEEG